MSGLRAVAVLWSQQALPADQPTAKSGVDTAPGGAA